MTDSHPTLSPEFLSIVMPCLNEAETLERCIVKAKRGLELAGIDGEVIIADNGSNDGSQGIAARCGARVIPVASKGYGSALLGGIGAAQGQWILMADSDDSYDLSDIAKFVGKLKEGYDLVMGCRLPTGGGTIMPGAMPWKNRWIGNPSLSFLGRFLFRTPITDFHCGMRAFTKSAIAAMDLQTTGMEFASEMVMKATLWRMKIAQVPITLHPDGRNRPPHLRPWRDGWRHLRFMLIYSPRWLFLVPGLALFLISGILTLILYFGTITVNGIHLDSGTLLLCAMGMIAGCQLVAFAVCTKVFGIGEGLLPQDAKFASAFRFFTLEKGLVGGIVLVLAGLALIADAAFAWGRVDFGSLSYSENMRRLVPAATMSVLGIQVIFTSFFLSVLGLKTTRRTPPESNPS